MELDHVVLEVRDPLATAEFYRRALGLRPVRLAAFRAGKAPFLSVRISAGTVVDLFPPTLWRGKRPTNPGHFCLATSRAGLAAFARRCQRLQIPIAERAQHNFGARGYADSLYIDDIEGNRIELRAY